MRFGAVVLCGGKSRRMGLPKATLPFGPESMLQRVVRLVGGVVDSIVVVAAPGQELPELAPGVEVLRDRHQDCGPLEGLAVGLAALRDRVEAVYATSCDVPLLVPAFVEKLFALLGDDEIVVPKEEKFHHPLSAVYRPAVCDRIEMLLAEGRLRPRFLFDACRTLEIPVEQLRCVDPELTTLQNLNRPEDYFATLRQEGFEAPASLRAALLRPTDN